MISDRVDAAASTLQPAACSDIHSMKSVIIFAAAAAALATTACKQEKEIKVYRVAKTSPAAEQAKDPHAGMMPGAADAADPHAGIPGMDPAADPHAGIPGMSGAGDPHAGMTPQDMAMMGGSRGPKVADQAPQGWTQQPGSSMRQLSYRVNGEDGATADVSLVILGGSGGAKLPNVNRWRAQFDLPALDADSLGANSETFTTALGEALLVDLEGLPLGADEKKDGRMLGAIIDHGRDGWFFRMRGNAALIAAQKDAFVSWVKSVKPGEPTAETAPDAAQKAPAKSDAAEPPCCPADEEPAAHADHTPAVAAAPAPAPAPAGDGRLVWQAPAGWVLDPAAGSMRFATFRINHPDGSKGEIAVTHFPGDVGGDLANVNRWRGQIGLEPINEAALAPAIRELTAGPRTLKVIDFSGPQTRCAAGWILHGGETWFFKFTGPDALVEAEMTNFNTFLKSIRFTTPE